MTPTPTTARWVAFAASKGGVSKSTVALATAVWAAHDNPGKKVAFLGLDTNNSVHERFVRIEDREELGPDDAVFHGPLWWIKPPQLPRRQTLNHLLLDASLAAEALDASTIEPSLYRRPELDNLAVLLHIEGTLTLLSNHAASPAYKPRLRRVIEHLSSYDLVIVDTPADQEVGLVAEMLEAVHALVPVTDSSRGGADSLAGIIGTGIKSEVPVFAIVQSPAVPWFDPERDPPNSPARMRATGVAVGQRTASQDVHAMAEALGLELVRVPRDAFIPNTEESGELLPLAWAQLKDGERSAQRPVGRNETSPRAAEVLRQFAQRLLEVDDAEIDRRNQQLLAIHRSALAMVAEQGAERGAA